MTPPESRPTISAEQFLRVCEEIRSTANLGRPSSDDSATRYPQEEWDQIIRDSGLRVVRELGLALSTDNLPDLLKALMAPARKRAPGGFLTREDILDMPNEPG